ncbi:glycosyltransferase family 2 protein [Cryomorpha ignava]|uniref:Glycosyltransferase family 2 protein n=1 Tax=Cryomorpha ignava TaxID=101383 RepID=A0A7K3WQU6_9FLAO|nr:glycosyltransferase family 2 protein [Cryomorpha ignava]NEN24059.1 glycosyltransferase family 2 protein [Cryomorpha ignava]
MNPKLTVITPNYNKGDAVIQCVQSVLNQSFEDWEFIFIDDGSTDGSFEKAIESADGDERCLFLKNTTGIKGGNASRNLGIEQSKSELIIFLDSDDLMMENCLMDRNRDFEANPDLDFIVYPMGIFNDTIGDSDFISNIPTSTPDLHRFLDRDVVWLISGPIWRKSTLESLGCFDLSLHSQQDYDLHVRALIVGFKYRYIHKSPDIFYRQNTESLPRKSSQSVDHFRQRFQMILRHADLLAGAEKLGKKERLLLARYILDIAQMMRWHTKTLGKNALKEALEMWKQTYDLGLVDKNKYGVGYSYLRFKHNMMYNRLGFLQRYLEKSFRKNLGDYIFSPVNFSCRVKLSDYARN